MGDQRIYLAGPVAVKDNGGAGWRDRLAETYPDTEFLDPLAKWNAPAEELSIIEGEAGADQVSVSEIVEADKRLVDEADAVLIGYEHVRSVGTPMETHLAWQSDTPVVLWIRDGTAIGDISPWYRYHVDAMTYNRDRAVEVARDD